MKLKTIQTLLFAGLIATGSLAAQSVREREANQQDRIQQGVATGELTPHEAKKLERKEAKIRRDIRKERADDGYLSASERAKIQKEQNRVSKKIYKEKHDNQDR